MNRVIKRLNFLSKVTILSSLHCCVFANTDPAIDPYQSVTQAIEEQTQSIEDLLSRNNGSEYLSGSSLEGRVHFMKDFIDFHQNLAKEGLDREQDLFFMQAPSLQSYTSDVDAIAQYKMKFSPIISSLIESDSSIDGASKNSLRDKTGYFFLKRGFLNGEDVNTDQDTTQLTNKFPNRGPRTDKGIYSTSLYVGNPRTMVRYHFQNYCDNYSGSTTSSDSTNENICKNFLGDLRFNGYSPDLASADMNAESLFSPSQNEAAQDYIQNITDPFPKNLFGYRQEGASYVPDADYDVEVIANSIVDKSYRSLSQYVLNDIRNRHSKQDFSSSESDSSGQNLEQVSIMELIEKMSTDRINNRNQWIENIESTSTEGLLREIAIIESTRLFIDYIKLQQSEHTEALLAASLSQNQNLMEMLKNLVSTPDGANEFIDDTILG